MTKPLPIEREAIAATAALHLRDPEELAAEVCPVWKDVGWLAPGQVSFTFQADPSNREAMLRFIYGNFDRPREPRILNLGPGRLLTAPLGTPPPGVNPALTAGRPTP